MFSKSRHWFIPLLLVAGFVFALSLRQLSDPDLGFHLKYGEWISKNLSVPDHDLSTYTVSGNSYTDLHWLFQVMLYQLFRIGGYPMISVFFCLEGCLLFLLLLHRNNREHVPLPFSIAWLLMAFIIIDPRLAPRPEMFTFILMTVMLILLDSYDRQKKGPLFLLPVIMVLWCNVHSLFFLGIGIMLIFFFSKWVSEKKPDIRLLGWSATAIAACMLNPYGTKGFLFPVQLLSRFNPGNIYNQHIQEFVPLLSQPEFQYRDYLFMVVMAMAVLLLILRLKETRLHEAILIILTGTLALVSVRNVPLFVLAAFPLMSRHSASVLMKIKIIPRATGTIFFTILVLIPLLLVSRVLTNAYYLENNSFNKTGLGINFHHQPLNASRFLTENKLDGRILNSIGFGGWLSWSLPQPVFIDGRLEVMQESLYQEVTTSWRGELSSLIARYEPDLIIYNYLKYFPWTLQLRYMKDWRLIYADGLAVIFARHDYRTDIASVPVNSLPVQCNPIAVSELNSWLTGCYKVRNFSLIDQLHLAMFRAEMMPGTSFSSGGMDARYYFNEANEHYRKADYERARICYDSAIQMNPEYARAYNNRGILRVEKMHDLLGALNDFSEAVRIDPTYGDAWVGSGSVRLLMHDTTGACMDWKHARSLGNQQATRLIQIYCSP